MVGRKTSKAHKESLMRMGNAYRHGADIKQFLLDKDIEFLRKGEGECGENEYSFIKLRDCGLIEDVRLLLDCRIRWRRNDMGDRFLAERGLLGSETEK